MVKSSFSGKELPPGKGTMYVKKDGKILYFLNKKEEKNMLKLKRKPRETAWTESYHEEKGQRIAISKAAAEQKQETDAPKKKSTKKKTVNKKKVDKKSAVKKKSDKKKAKKSKK